MKLLLLLPGATEVFGTGILDTGSGYNAQNAMPVHFGMAGRERVDVEITSMTKGGRKISRLTNVSPGGLPNNCLAIRIGLDGQPVK